MSEEGRNVEERTFCFGTLTVIILATSWLFGRPLSVEDLYIAVTVAFVYSVTIPASDSQSVVYAVICTLFPMWLVGSPAYLMGWNTTLQKWPVPTVAALGIGYVAFWIHYYFRNWHRKWMTESEYIKSFDEVENLPQPLIAEE